MCNLRYFFVQIARSGNFFIYLVIALTLTMLFKTKAC